MTATILAFTNCPPIPEIPYINEDTADSWVSEVLVPLENDAMSQAYTKRRIIAALWVVMLVSFAVTAARHGLLVVA